MARVCQRFATFFLIWYCCIKLVKTNKHYKEEIVLLDAEECFGDHRKEIIFDYGTAINLTFYYLNDYHNRWKNRKIDITCRYRLQPVNEDSGIFATIQELSLQSRGNECFAFVEFGTAQGRRSKELCGTLRAEQVMNLEQKNFDTQSHNNTFITNGAMDMNIVIPKEAINRDLKINIIFTLYKYCINKLEHGRPCLETREFCIHENFFYDDVINCPFFGCVDEGSCVKNLFTQSLEYKLFIGIITFMVFFAIFIIGFSICWVYGKPCCFSPPRNRNNPTEAQVTRVIELEDVSNEFQNTNTQPLSYNEDKDLPPPYESLFPSRMAIKSTRSNL